MSKIVSASVGITLAMLIACDPGMTIRQGALPSNVSGSNRELVVRIGTSHPLIGERQYGPKVEVRSLFDSPVIITTVDLVSRRETYANRPLRTGSYPVSLPPRRTESLDVRFELAEPVHKAFKEPAELRVHYTLNGRQQIASASLVGGPLN